MDLFETEVKLGRNIPSLDLEKMLIEAAREMGWKVQVVESKKKEYQLGSVQEREVYQSTSINLKGTFFPKFRVLFRKNLLTNNNVFLYNPLSSSISPVTEREVNRYLQALSQRVQAYQAAEAAP
ncbi:MAG: hypothetical protein AABX13_06385 [Nanoarchaeota archaeon]